MQPAPSTQPPSESDSERDNCTERNRRGSGERQGEHRSSPTALVLLSALRQGQQAPPPSPVVTPSNLAEAIMGTKPGTARYQGKTKAWDEVKNSCNWPTSPDIPYEQVSVKGS